MRVFKNKKEPLDENNSSIIAQKLQSGWAGWMNQRTTSLTKRDWIITLICFVILMGGFSTYLIVSGFTGTKAEAFKIGTMRKPAHTGETGESSKAAISDLEYNRIVRFHKYMDSLSANRSGKRVYDSLVQKRPGLMDSLQQIEKYYQQLNHKQSWKTKR